MWQVGTLQDSLSMVGQVMNAFCQLPGSQAILLSQGSGCSSTSSTNTTTANLVPGAVNSSAANNGCKQQIEGDSHLAPQSAIVSRLHGSNNSNGQLSMKSICNNLTSVPLTESLSSLTSSISALTSNIVTSGSSNADVSGQQHAKEAHTGQCVKIGLY